MNAKQISNKVLKKHDPSRKEVKRGSQKQTGQRYNKIVKRPGPMDL
jgi:hypothetical protein